MTDTDTSSPEVVELQKQDTEETRDLDENEHSCYDLAVDEEDDDRATEIKLFSLRRPHMRAFHCAWFSFFCAFFIWFAAAPLLPAIQATLGLTTAEIWNSNIASVLGTIITRFINGPLCDKYNARVMMGTTLIIGAIPTALTGLVNSGTGLSVLRFFIGLTGSSFVMCQHWSASMFTRDIVGTANGMAAGWGNLGGGVTQIVMGSALFPLFQLWMSPEMAWRTVCIVPAVVTFLVALMVMRCSDDTPKSYKAKMCRQGHVQSAAEGDPEEGVPDGQPHSAEPEKKISLIAFRNTNAWILSVLYGCSFGMELTMNNISVTFYTSTFGLSIEAASAVASLFGWMNIFARPLGGFCSDKMNGKFGMKGRIAWLIVTLLMEGVLVISFFRAYTLAASIVLFVLFASVVQGAEGAVYAIVPYVKPSHTGGVSGVVGAGGPIGALIFQIIFRELNNTELGGLVIGVAVFVLSALCLLLFIPGHPSLLCGRREEKQKESTSEETPRESTSEAVASTSEKQERSSSRRRSTLILPFGQIKIN